MLICTRNTLPYPLCKNVLTVDASLARAQSLGSKKSVEVNAVKERTRPVLPVSCGTSSGWKESSWFTIPAQLANSRVRRKRRRALTVTEKQPTCLPAVSCFICFHNWPRTTVPAVAIDLQWQLLLKLMALPSANVAHCFQASISLLTIEPADVYLSC
jgi:hypothetical protein